MYVSRDQGQHIHDIQQEEEAQRLQGSFAMTLSGLPPSPKSRFKPQDLTSVTTCAPPAENSRLLPMGSCTPERPHLINLVDAPKTYLEPVDTVSSTYHDVTRSINGMEPLIPTQGAADVHVSPSMTISLEVDRSSKIEVSEKPC